MALPSTHLGTAPTTAFPVSKSQPLANGASNYSTSNNGTSNTDASNNVLTELDRAFQIGVAAVTSGISPASVGLAYADWWMHLALSPGKVAGLYLDAWQKTLEVKPLLFWAEHWSTNPSAKIEAQDPRFKEAEWDRFPFSLYRHYFLTLQNWWQGTTTDVKGVSQRHLAVVNYINRQILDALSPNNFIFSNPVVLKKMSESFGQSLAVGYLNFVDDMRHLAAGELPRHLHPYQVGVDLAITPGKVVYRNRLMELIQYSPQTKRVYAEPVLIVPAWIMKYYILDLAPNQSLVEYLVQQDHTVFLISWKNPTVEDRNIGFNDYMKLGFIEALDAINRIMPDRKIHAAGYCIGGILLTIGVAWLSRLNDKRLQSVTLLAAQTDFDSPGELSMFMDASQLAFLDNIMKQQGYLDKFQMKSIFQMMRSNDLIWSYLIHHYLLGRRPKVTELMAWSADATRMPYKMHIEYLERLYLRDELAEGHYQVDGQEVVLDSIKLPIFCVATEYDHLSPWRSVYKLHLLADTEITFVLTNGGHNAGIISTLDHPYRRYRISKTSEDTPYTSPDSWLKANGEVQSGSWWPAWHQWLVERSSPQQVSAPSEGSKDCPVLCDAPGTYVYQK